MIVIQCIDNRWSQDDIQRVAVIHIVLIPEEECHAGPIDVPSPSSRILLQNTPDFIMTNKKISSQKSDDNQDPHIFIERRFNIPAV